MFHILERYVWEGNWHGKLSFSARHLILARHMLYFGVLRRAECQPVGFRVVIVVAEELC